MGKRTAVEDCFKMKVKATITMARKLSYLLRISILLQWRMRRPGDSMISVMATGCNGVDLQEMFLQSTKRRSPFLPETFKSKSFGLILLKVRPVKKTQLRKWALLLLLLLSFHPLSNPLTKKLNKQDLEMNSFSGTGRSALVRNSSLDDSGQG